MTEAEAWTVIERYARVGQVSIHRMMTVQVLRRTLAKKFQPRKSDDDPTAMQQINPALDRIADERDQRELLGQDPFRDPSDRGAAQPAGTSAKSSPKPGAPTGHPPWHLDPAEPSVILRNDFTDLNYLRKTIYERSIKFGNVQVVKAWAWDGVRFRKVVSALANSYAYEELARSLLVYYLQGNDAASGCDAVFLTEGEGRATHFQLVLLRSGRAYLDVSRYGLYRDFEPDDQEYLAYLPTWLEMTRKRMDDDSTMVYR